MDSDVPAGWVIKKSRSKNGRLYYHNPSTRESSWTLPQVSEKAYRFGNNVCNTKVAESQSFSSENTLNCLPYSARKTLKAKRKTNSNNNSRNSQESPALAKIQSYQDSASSSSAKKRKANVIPESVGTAEKRAELSFSDTSFRSARGKTDSFPGKRANLEQLSNDVTKRRPFELGKVAVGVPSTIKRVATKPQNNSTNKSSVITDISTSTSKWDKDLTKPYLRRPKSAVTQKLRITSTEKKLLKSGEMMARTGTGGQTIAHESHTSGADSIGMKSRELGRIQQNSCNQNPNVKSSVSFNTGRSKKVFEANAPQEGSLFSAQNKLLNAIRKRTSTAVNKIGSIASYSTLPEKKDLRMKSNVSKTCPTQLSMSLKQNCDEKECRQQNSKKGKGCANKNGQDAVSRYSVLKQNTSTTGTYLQVLPPSAQSEISGKSGKDFDKSKTDATVQSSKKQTTNHNLISSSEMNCTESIDVDMQDVSQRYEQNLPVNLMSYENEEENMDFECNQLTQESMKTHKGTSSTGAMLYVVVDTNVLISDVKFVENLKDQLFPGIGYPILVIPWVVLQELDAIKDGKQNLIASKWSKVRSPIRFLFRCFQSRHPRVIGQSCFEANATVEGFHPEVNDDKILHCCLQWKLKFPGSHVVLLTDDKNLCNKVFVSAMTNPEITAYTRQNILSGLKGLQTLSVSSNNATVSHFGFNTESAAASNSETVTVRENMTSSLENILQMLSELLTESLSVVMETDMKAIYGDLWQDITYHKPPWSFKDLLECLKKHWIAVFQDVLPREAQTSIEHLLNYVKSKNAPSNMHYVISLLQDSMKLCELLQKRSSLYGNGKVIPACLNQLKQLLDTCKETVTPIKSQVAMTMEPAEYSKSPQLKPHRPKTPDSEPKSSQDNRSIDNVEDIFQDVWGAVHRFSETIHQVLSSTESGTHESGNRAEAVQFLLKLHPLVKQLQIDYESALQVDVINIEEHSGRFFVLCQTLNGFFKRLEIPCKEMKLQSTTLKEYFVPETNREILQNGLIQLWDMLEKLDESMQHLKKSESLS